ncbi:MAG: hypothetical protein ACOCYD_01605 [bacterium]
MQKTLLSIALLLCLSVASLFSQSVKLPGFGTVEYSQNGDQYSIDFKDYGQFDFYGTMSPLNLTGKITLEQLKKFPGYVILENMNVRDIELELSGNGFFVHANISTEGSMKTLCEFLQIKEPYLSISARVATNGIAMRGGLVFEDEPLEIMLVPDMGTSIAYESVSIEADIGIDYEMVNDEESGRGLSVDITPEIDIVTQMLITPTKWDPTLVTETVFSYNLVTQEISGSGSIIDTWTNPFGIGQHFNDKEVMSLTNAAVSMGWIPMTPSPSKIGFFLEEGRLFDLTFSVAMDLSPTSGEVAFKAGRNKMTMNDFTRILREGFELEVPDIFPDDIYLENVELLFSPNGGAVGSFEVDEGLAIKGTAVFTDGYNGSLDFTASKDDGIFLYLNMNANFRDKIHRELSNNNILKPILNKILDGYEMKSIELLMDAQTNGKLAGSTKVQAVVLKKDISFSFEGSFDGERLAKEVIARVTEVGLQNVDLAEATRKVIDAAAKAGENSVRIANDAFRQAQKLAEEAQVAMDHATHTADQCYNHCVPNYVHKQTHTMLDGSNSAVKAFRDDIIIHLRDNVQGANEKETQRMRSDLIKSEWDQLTARIDSDWDVIDNDRTVIRFFLFPSDASKGRKKYRRMVNAEIQKHIQYRDKLWREMMITMPPRAEDGSRRRRPR